MLHVSSTGRRTHPPCLCWLSFDPHLTNLSPKLPQIAQSLARCLHVCPPQWKFPRERNFQRNTSSRLQLLLPPGSFFLTTCNKMRSLDWLPQQTTHIFNSKQKYWMAILTKEIQTTKQEQNMILKAKNTIPILPYGS